MSRSPIQCRPLLGDKRPSETAFSVKDSSHGNSRIEASPSSHSIISNGTCTQPNGRTGSSSDADFGAVPHPLSDSCCPLPGPTSAPSSSLAAGPSPGWASAQHPRVTTSLNSIWSSTFTIPAKTIINTQKIKGHGVSVLLPNSERN